MGAPSAFSSCAYRTQGPAIYCGDFPSKPLCAWIIGREPSWQLSPPPAQPTRLGLREPAEEQGHRTDTQQCCARLCSQICSGTCSPRVTGPQNQPRQGHMAWWLKDSQGPCVRLKFSDGKPSFFLTVLKSLVAEVAILKILLIPKAYTYLMYYILVKKYDFHKKNLTKYCTLYTMLWIMKNKMIH